MKRNVPPLCALSVLLPFALALGNDSPKEYDGATTETFTAFVESLRDDPTASKGNHDLSVDNSHIIIRTRSIDRVVACGPRALPALLREMRHPDVSLDTFVRCYSACDQILRKAGLPDPVYWHGGLIDTDKAQGTRIVKLSRLDGFSAGFRREQVQEIVQRASEIALHLGDSTHRPPQ
jgi:hypothetical protein